MEFSTHWDAVFNPHIGSHYFDRAGQLPFEALATEFSLSNAWWLAELSRWIYNIEGMADGNRSKQQNYLATGSLQEIAFFSARGTHASLVQSKAPSHNVDFVALVFRGSSEPRNWLTNALNLPSEQKTHLGYEKALDQVWDKIDDALSGITCPVYLTGHSMGGALAALAAQRRAATGIYTFGAPKVVSEGHQKSLTQEQMFRVTNFLDLASRMPMSDRYSHLGQWRYISRECELWFNPAASLVEADQIEGGRELTLELNRDKRVAIPEAISDHAPANYVAHLERLALNPSLV